MRNGHFASPWAWLALSWVLLLALLLASPSSYASKTVYLERVTINAEIGAGHVEKHQSIPVVVENSAQVPQQTSSVTGDVKVDHSNPLMKKSTLTDGGTPISRSCLNYPTADSIESPDS